MVPDNSDGIPRVPPYSGTGPAGPAFRVRDSHPLRRRAPSPSATLPPRTLAGPMTPARAETPPVWAPPLSLAATRGIVLTFFSCGYLDVSVPRVRLRGFRGWRDRSRRVPPFGYLRVTVHLPLAAAFRSLSRPSSPPRAKASPMRPCVSRYIVSPSGDLSLTEPSSTCRLSICS